jgi:hypothetical protein
MNLQEHIRRIIKEETEHLSKQDNLKQMVLKLGWEKVAQMLGGFDNLYRVAFNNDYNEFLNLFNNLEVVQSEKKPKYILYRFEKGNNIMVYDTKNHYVHLNDKLIWSFFEIGIGLNYGEIQDITENWLDEVHNLRGITSADFVGVGTISLNEVYNLN